ncbi:MAG: glycosyltransferase family 9 protein, partial [Planctomycetota bacterium]
VMAEPALRALEAALPRGNLTLLGLAPHLELLARRFPTARRVPLAARDCDAPEHYAGHDVALLCTGSFRSAWAAFRARVPRRVGFARDGRALLLTDALTPARERGGVPLELGRAGRGRRWLPRPLTRSLAELLGLLGVPLEHPEPRLDVEPEALAHARARRAAGGLDPDAPFVLVHAGARPGSSKGVPPALWLAAVRLVARSEPLAWVLTAGPGEEAALHALARELGGPRVCVLQAPPALLPELVAHTAEARVVWSGDSGPRHLARALARPVLVVAGPTDPRHCAVGERERLLRAAVPCGPCHRERCVLGGADELQCYGRLAPELFSARTQELLALPAATMPG